MQKNKNLVYFTFLAIYSLFLYLIYTRNGIITQNEAEKYILAARELSNGNIGYTLTHHFFYSSYVLFITLFIKIGGINAVIAAQASLTFISAICIHKIILLLTKKEGAAYTGMFLYLISYPLQIWVLTLFSDSFFVALLSITLFYTFKKKSRSELIVWGLLVLLLIFARPPGIFLSILFVNYYLCQNRFFKKTHLLISTVVAFVLIFTAIFYLPVGTKDYIKPVAAGAIIVDQPDYNIPRFNSLEKSNLLAAYRYLNDQKGGWYIVSLYLNKLHSFFTLTRPYYSNLHNTVMILHYPLYILSIAGLFLLKNKATRYLLLLSVFLLANLTALTYNEWHYRFTIAIFPFLIILASIAINHLFALFSKTRKTIPEL